MLVAALPNSGCTYSVLVPNQKGYELALSAGITDMGLVVSATELMNQNNIGKGLEDTFSSAEIILERALEDGVDIHVYLAVAFECPYEGLVAPATVIDQVNRLMRWRPSRLMVADTIGALIRGRSVHSFPSWLHSMVLRFWGAIFTIPAQWQWLMCLPRWSTMSDCLIVPSEAWGAALLHRARRAIWRRRTLSPC